MQNTPMNQVLTMEAAFAKLHTQYRSRKKAAEGMVHEWKWATASRYDLRPLYFERHGWAPGRTIRQIPSDKNGYVSYGIDSSGAVMVERQFNEFGCYESFFTRTSDTVDIAHFHYIPDKLPICLIRVKFLGGNPIASFHAAIGGFDEETYKWDGPRVSEVHVRHAKRDEGILSPLKAWHVAQATYDSHGVLQRVELIWPREAPGQSAPSVELMFERRGSRIFRRSP